VFSIRLSGSKTAGLSFGIGGFLRNIKSSNSSKTGLELAAAACSNLAHFLSTMTEPDRKTTLREFQEYLDLSCESSREIAARIGVAQRTTWAWLAGKSQPKAQSLAKLRRFLDAEAKRPAQGDGIRPIEGVPYKVIKPIQQVRYARLCPFCRKARGKIRKLGAASFQGVCPKCEATGPKRESHQEALRAWNGRE
jgi:transcriptional regulator with XRE-family HTH domain